MSLRSLQSSHDQGAADPREHDPVREASFRMRLASQQFLKHHGPLIRALVRAGGSADEIVRLGTFETKAREARSLAVAIASKVLNKPEAQVTMSDARHFRQEAAEIVAQAWEEGRVLDRDNLSSGIATAVLAADDEYDAETVQWSKLTALGNTTLTAASVALALSRAVAIYDFRLGRELVLSTLTSSVVEATREAVDAMSHSAASQEDRRSLSQTTLRSLSGLMAQIYENKARESLAALVTLSERERTAWLRREGPLEAIVTEFRAWARNVHQIAAAAARETLAASRDLNPTPSK